MSELVPDALNVLALPLNENVDVREAMVERRGGLRLEHEALFGERVSGQRLRQECQRDDALEAEILALVDLAHSAAPESLEDAVVRHRSADQVAVP
jgi:hypothetical protein